MFKKLRVAMVMLAAAFAVTVGVGSFALADDKVPDISTIMKTVYSKGGLKGKVSGALKGEKWDDVKKYTAEIKAHGESLAKNKVPKGDADSWKKLTTNFKEATAAADEAAGKKDDKALTAAFSKIVCKTCHDAHR